MAFADGNTASTSASASVQILAPVTASNDGNALAFGKVIVQGAGSVTVSAGGALAATGLVSLYLHNPGTTPVPHFFITKDPSASVSVNIPLTLALGSGIFTPDPSVFTLTGQFATSGLASNGSAGQAVWGSLAWTAAVPLGAPAVTGTMPIVVNYI
jgi:hypothetical protein